MHLIAGEDCGAFRGVDDAIGTSLRVGEDEQKPASPRVEVNMSNFLKRNIFNQEFDELFSNREKNGCERK